MEKIAVIAVGGNAIMPDGNQAAMDIQYANICQMVQELARIMQEGWRIVLVHGNGPQVGLVLRQSELSKAEVPPVSMEYAGAFTQGALGYMFVNAMYKVFKEYKIDKSPQALITRTQVDANDPAFKSPSKPVGSWYSQQDAMELSVRLGWHIVEDSGRGWRRVVPSPKPVKIIELENIKRMVELDIPVVCVGGGGIPVVEAGSGLSGIDAVIDKDMSAALLAQELGASMLILPTAVEKVAINFGKPEQRWLDTLSLEEARSYLAEGQFPAGSMGPKVQALVQYVQTTRGTGIITTAQGMHAAVNGLGGTRVVP